MKNNPKLLIVVGGIAVAVIFGFFWSHSGSNSSAQGKGKASNTDQHQAFDVASGDTNNEVLKSIVARQKALQDQNKRLMAENKQLQEDKQKSTSTALEKAKESLTQKINQSKAALESQFSKELEDVKSKVHQGKSNQSSDLEYPMAGSSSSQDSKKDHIITRVPDLSSGFDQGTDSQGFEHTNSGNSAFSDTGPTLPSDTSNSDSNDSKPFYTIPALSTAANAVLLSPLIGEVPVNGQLEAPAFPFKAILSPRDAKNMFTANGVPLPPGISGAILQGYSVGSMSMGCARAYVMRILFVFQDGHYVVFPKDKGGQSNSATQVYPKNSIGYLSDAYNNSCMTGKYLTDAPKVIASLAGFGAASGVGGAIAQAQTQTLSNISQGTSGSIFTGNLGKYAAGVAIGDASKAALDWYKARVNDIFDAVFIPSTQAGKPRKLIFNVTKTIPIDLDQKGRRLSYENSSEMSATDTSFE